MRIEFKNPVAGLYSRRAGSQIAYWLSVLGYNVHDRSFTNRMYAIYFCLFWGIWILVMFFLLSYILNTVLRAISLPDLLQHSSMVLAYLLAGWAVYQLWMVSGRSPFMFSEEDSFLLCQTPVNRRTVGLARFFMAWPITFLLFGGVTWAVAFTRVEAGIQAGPSIALVGQYLGASLRALLVLMPLQMGLQAALWGLGALRISPPLKSQYRRQQWLRGLTLLVAVLLIGGLFLPHLGSILLSILSVPIQAGLGEGEAAYSWAGGFGVSLLTLAGGLFLLVLFVKNISLNQAARETKLPLAIQTARSFLSLDLANALIERERLVRLHSFAWLPAGKGHWTLVWKDAIQSLRSIRLGVIFQWGLLFCWTVVMFTNSSWVVQLASAGAWAIQAGTLTTQRARKDLSHWWLFHSMPMNIMDKVKAEISLPVIGVTLMGCLGIILSGRAMFPALAAGVMLPMLAVNAALASLHDILRHVETRLLLTPSIADENVPQPSTEGILVLLVSTLAPFLLFQWQMATPVYALTAPAAIILAAAITLMLARNIRGAYRWIE